MLPSPQCLERLPWNLQCIATLLVVSVVGRLQLAFCDITPHSSWGYTYGCTYVHTYVRMYIWHTLKIYCFAQRPTVHPYSAPLHFTCGHIHRRGGEGGTATHRHCLLMKYVHTSTRVNPLHMYGCMYVSKHLLNLFFIWRQEAGVTVPQVLLCHSHQRGVDHLHTQTQSHTVIGAYVRTYVDTYTHTHTHTHTHTRTHIKHGRC